MHWIACFCIWPQMNLLVAKAGVGIIKQCWYCCLLTVIFWHGFWLSSGCDDYYIYIFFLLKILNKFSLVRRYFTKWTTGSCVILGYFTQLKQESHLLELLTCGFWLPSAKCPLNVPAPHNDRVPFSHHSPHNHWLQGEGLDSPTKTMLPNKMIKWSYLPRDGSTNIILC